MDTECGRTGAGEGVEGVGDPFTDHFQVSEDRGKNSYNSQKCQDKGNHGF